MPDTNDTRVWAPVVGDLVTGSGVSTGDDITGRFLGDHEVRSTHASAIEDPNAEYNPWYVLTDSLRPADTLHVFRDDCWCSPTGPSSDPGSHTGDEPQFAAMHGDPISPAGFLTEGS